MENNENNNLNELEQLKAEYETLKGQLDQQEIVNDRLMKSAMQTDTDFFVKNRRTVMIAYPIMALLGFAYMAYFGFWSFAIGFVLLLAVMIVVELWLTRNTKKQEMENSDLLTLSQNMQKLKTGYAIYTTLLLIVGFLFVAAFTFKKIDSFNLRGAQFMSEMWSVGFAGVLLLIFAILAYRNFVGHCNNVIRQIDAVEGRPTTKKNWTFWRFLGGMALLMVGGICLVYQIMKPTDYTRPENDLITEGKLEIWEVYADTTLSAKEASVLMDQWQPNDSLTLMVERNPDGVIGMDDLSVHSWKEDNGLQVKLYTLKKTTPEGPVLSSAVIGGKPMVQEVTLASYSDSETTPIIVFMTPDAKDLWYEYTKKASETGKTYVAITLDGMVYQSLFIQGGLSNGTFFLMKRWTKDGAKAFCKMLIHQ